MTIGSPTGSLLRWAVALWLPAAVAVTVAAAAAYGVGQSIARSAANDPQIQLAQDGAAELAAGSDAAAVADGPQVDLATSLAVATTVVSRAGTILASTGRLDGVEVRPPLGALAAATSHEPRTVTWQPRRDVRMAAVIVPYSGAAGSGTVVVARSLRVVEQRDSRLLVLVAAGWLGGLVATAIAAVGGSRLVAPRAGAR
jgi:hypothetical protein